MKRESARVAISAEDLINSCFKQGELFGISRASMFEAMSMLLVQNSASSPVSGTPTLTYDKAKDGWKLVENVTEPATIDISNFETVSFLRGGESYVNGEVMRQRAIEMNCHLGQQHAEYILTNQDQIPKEFRKHYLVFPGTVWQGPGGSRYVPCLYWLDGQWRLYFNWLDFDWHGNGRLLSTRK